MINFESERAIEMNQLYIEYNTHSSDEAKYVKSVRIYFKLIIKIDK